MSAQPFDPIADLHMAVEQIKREPKPQPDMVPWDEYMKNRATEMSDKLTPTRVLRARFHIEQQLSAPGSLSGYQADRLAMGLSGPSGNGARSNGQDNLRAQLGDLLLLCRDLTQQEETVCRLKYGAQGQIETYRRHRRPCDMRTGDGEDVVNAKTEHEGFVEVEGKQAQFPILGDIAAQVGLTKRQVRARLSSAASKIAAAIQERK